MNDLLNNKVNIVKSTLQRYNIYSKKIDKQWVR